MSGIEADEKTRTIVRDRASTTENAVGAERGLIRDTSDVVLVAWIRTDDTSNMSAMTITFVERIRIRMRRVCSYTKGEHLAKYGSRYCMIESSTIERITDEVIATHDFLSFTNCTPECRVVIVNASIDTIYVFVIVLTARKVNAYIPIFMPLPKTPSLCNLSTP